MTYIGVFILAIVNLIGTNILATQGAVLDNLLGQINKTSKENQIVSVEINKISNLNYMQSTAVALGFRRVRANLIISPIDSVASAIQ